MAGTTREQREQERADAIARLRQLFGPDARIHTIVRHVSRSRETHSISVVGISTDGGRTDLWDVSGDVARAVGWRFNAKHGGVNVHGGGMDLPYLLAHTLMCTLYPDDPHAFRHQSL